MHALLAWEGASSMSAGNLTLAAGDIIAVLTGETDKNNLSAMNLPGGTSIASAYPAGWEVYDSGAGVHVTYPDAWILRAPTVDDPTQYKYVKLAFRISSNYMYIDHSVMESWDAGTNIATNECTVDSINYCRFPTQSYSNNTMEIVATARFIFFRTNIYSTSYSFPCMEISRIHPCLEIGSGRVPAVQVDNVAFGQTNFTVPTYTKAAIPRMLDDAGTADITNLPLRCTNGGGRPSTNISNEFDNLAVEVGYDNANNPSYGVQQILFEYRELVGQVCGDSTVADIFIMQGQVVAGFEDRTLHTLDTTDDRRIMWTDTQGIINHGDIRIVIQAE
jgi:hypothetical protein